MVLFRHNLPQPTQAQLIRGEFPETPCIEQGVVLSCRFAEWKVRRAPRVLRMAVVSQSSVKYGKKRVFLVGTINFRSLFITIFEDFPKTKFKLSSSMMGGCMVEIANSGCLMNSIVQSESLLLHIESLHCFTWSFYRINKVFSSVAHCCLSYRR